MRYVILAGLMAILVTVSPASARHPRHRGNQGARAAAAQREAAFLRQFDANGDGQLDPTERGAAQTALKQMKAARTGQAGGAAGNLAKEKGKLADKLTPEQKKELVKRFDKDGDGKLDADEREAAKQELKKQAANP